MSLEKLHIGIAGLIGVGKTTLATALGTVLGLPVYYEPVIDNEYLADFYADQARYAFALQIYLLNKRFQQQQQIVWSDEGGIQDRTIYEDTIFARMLNRSGMMDDRDYRTYVSLFSHMSNFMKKPNLIVYLTCTPEESLARIKSRSRDCESSIPLDYLKNLEAVYEEFIVEISRTIPVIRVDWSKYRTAEEMAQVIKQEYERISYIRKI